jgi:hypothetical protein
MEVNLYQIGIVTARRIDEHMPAADQKDLLSALLQETRGARQGPTTLRGTEPDHSEQQRINGLHRGP